MNMDLNIANWRKVHSGTKDRTLSPDSGNKFVSNFPKKESQTWICMIRFEESCRIGQCDSLRLMYITHTRTYTYDNILKVTYVF